jgi:hypothetical protein
MADGSAFARLSAADQQRLLVNFQAQCRNARLDPALFITTCGRTEKQGPVKLVPHQQLLLRFVRTFPMCIARMPRGASKTFLMTFLGLWHLGRARDESGLIISSEAGQAKQPLVLMKDYIEDGSLATVFPELRRSPDPKAAWRDDRIVVDRPPGIRTPSVRAAGAGGKLYGNRIHWAIIDDILNLENTNTLEQRNKIESIVETNVLGALPVANGRCVMTNTPWHRDDVTFRFEKRWPSITMSIDGYVWFANVPDPELLFGAWIRPSRIRPGRYRLRQYDPDPEEIKTLWPAQFPLGSIELLRSQWTPFNFARSFLCEPFDEASTRCLQEWVDWSFDAGAGQAWPAARTGTSPTYTGVDIGGVKKGHDNSAICSIELLPGGKRRMLNMQAGHWHGGELIRRLVEEVKRYDSHVYVESNGAQKFLADFAELEDRNMRVTRFDTGRNKYDETFGVEAVFTEMLKRQWIWPNSNGRPSELLELGKECVFYNPADHTGDRLMSLFLARQGLAKHRSVASSGGVGAQRSAIRGGGF